MDKEIQEQFDKVSKEISTVSENFYRHNHVQYDKTNLLREESFQFSDNTTNDATSSQHGFLPKLSNVSTEFLDGTGSYSTPNYSSLSYTVNADEDVSDYYTYPIVFLATSSTAISGFTVTNCGLGSITGGGGYCPITSTNTGWSIQDFIPGSGSNGAYVASDGKTIRVKIRAKFDATTNIRSFGIFTSASALQESESGTTATARFVENAGTLYAQNASGTTATNTDVSSGITRTNWNLYEIVFTPTVDVKFYINGTLVATHTTNLFTTGNTKFGLGGDSSTQTIIVAPATISIQN